MIRLTLVLACLALPSPVWAASFDFGSLPPLGIVNLWPTQALSLDTLTVSTPSPDRLTWSSDGLGVTGPSERTFATRVVGLPYEWDEVESTQQISLVWPEPVYVEALGLSNFFAGEQRRVSFDEQLWLGLDGSPDLVTATDVLGEFSFANLGWLSVITLDAPGGWLDHEFTLRRVAWHEREQAMPEPGSLVLLAAGLLAAGQLAARRGQ